LDQLSKVKSYEAADNAKRNAIARGIRVSAGLAPEGEVPPENLDAWAEQYIKAGGKPTGVRQFLMDNLRKADEPSVQRLQAKLKNGGDRINFLLDLEN
jgi:hypothetical protein